MMNWHDSLLWNIRPDCKPEAVAVLSEIRAAGLHRDNLSRGVTKAFANWFGLDELPIDTVDENIAVVSVVGPLVNVANPFTASYPMLKAAFEKVRESRQFEACVVRFKSPGGTVSGLQDCAAALDQLANEKLTVAQVDGGCYSAAYYLASQCGTICCGPTDHVGNIGCVMSLDDYSEMWRAAGVRSVTKKTGPLKGLGIFGDPITDAQETFLQALVDQHFAHFRDAVMSGRGMTDEQFDAVSSGAFWLGETAIGLNLIDHVSTLDQTIETIRNQLA